MLGDSLEDAAYTVCVQAVLFFIIPVSKKCQNHPFYVERKFGGLPKELKDDLEQNFADFKRQPI
jgi:hypothetical protein